jgi:hypothetical protein
MERKQGAMILAMAQALEQREDYKPRLTYGVKDDITHLTIDQCDTTIYSVNFGFLSIKALMITNKPPLDRMINESLNIPYKHNSIYVFTASKIITLFNGYADLQTDMSDLIMVLDPVEVYDFIRFIVVDRKHKIEYQN